MKLILVLVALLWFLLSWFSNSVGLKAEEITTDNLISQDFTDGSWNNPVNSWHAPNDLAGWNGMEHTTEVTYTPETEALKLNGFEMTAGGEIFHWYNGQTVYVNQSVTLDNGTVFEQTKSYTASRGTVHDVENTIVINSNTSASYDLGMGILFEDTRGLDGHRSADFRDPFITLTYDDTVFQLDEVVEQELTNLFTEFKPEKDLKLEETFKVVELFNEPIEIKEELKIEEFIKIVSMPEKTPEPEVMEEMVEEFIEEVVEQKEEIKEDIKEEIAEEIKEDIKEKITEEPTKEPTKETAKETTNESKSVEAATGPKEKEIKKKETKVVSLDDVLEKIDEKVKDIGKNLQLKNLVKIKVMTSDNRLEEYNIPFYDNRIIYDNQINIADNRVIYQVDLAEYKQNDPIIQRRIKLNTVLQERQDLINQLKVLKNG